MRALLRSHREAVLTALAFVVLDRLGLLREANLSVLLALLVAGTLVKSVAQAVLPPEPGLAGLNFRALLSATGTTAVMYATGWGPMLAVGYVFNAADQIRRFGARATSPVLLWSMAGLAAGQVAIAVGLAPTVIPAPRIHAIGLLGGLGAAFVIHVVGSMTSRLEDANSKKNEVVAALRGESERYESLLNALSDLGEGVLIADGSRIVYANDALSRINGYTFEELQALPSFFSIVVPEERQVIADRLRRRLLGGAEPGHYDTTILHKDGHRVALEVSVKLLTHGDHPQVISVCRDVSERKRSEEALRQSEERFRAASEHAMDAIVLADEDGRITYFNPAAQRLFGWSQSEAEGRPLTMLMPQRYRRQHHEGIERYGRTGQSTLVGHTIELFGLRRNGSEFPLELSLSAWSGDRGRQLMGILRDIEQRKIAEDALREALAREQEAAERLRHLDEMKNAFLEAVSHELRTPLTVVRGLAATLTRHRDRMSPHETADLLVRLDANARRLDELLTSLLDLDRLERGVVQPHRRRTDLTALVQHVVDQLELGDHRIEVEVAKPFALVDAAHVERIIENLLVNSVKHTPDGTRVWVRVWPSAEDLLLEVEDDGPGVPDALKPTIFDPFVQGSGSRHAPGTGIGLALVARFAELHGGRAWVEDRPGRGSRFCVQLSESDAGLEIESGARGPARDSSEHLTRQ